MNKVVTIKLNHNTYQVEEEGYNALRVYLDKAAAKLHDNPDKNEIMADFEQAIADKSAKYLKKGKNVLTVSEINEVLAQMGPVEDAPEPETTTHSQTGAAGPPKRLFKIREGAVFEGVCNGIAAYFDLDATIVRVAFIILTVITGGAWIFAYILMALFMPEARTAEDIAAAQGKPFNAQTLLKEARERLEYWKQFGKDQQKEWKSYSYETKKDWNQWKYEQKAAWKRTPSAAEIEKMSTYKATTHRVSRGFAGVLGGTGVLVLLALTVAWIWSLVIILTGGNLFGYFGGVSGVVLTVLLSAVFYVIFLPLQSMVGNTLRYASDHATQPYFWGKFVTFVLWVGAAVTVGYIVNTDTHARDGFVRLFVDASHYFHR